MKAVVQKCLSASVSVDGETISSIQKGLMCLVGIGKDDGEGDLDTVARQILTKRLWPDDTGKQWQRNVMDMQYEVLCVSQFTLQAQTRKGAKPDFHNAMAASESQELYATLLRKLRLTYQEDKIFDGRFQAMMNVSLVNEGPITLIYDTKEGSDAAHTSKQKEVADAKARRKAEIEQRTLANKARKSQSNQESDLPTTN